MRSLFFAVLSFCLFSCNHSENKSKSITSRCVSSEIPSYDVLKDSIQTKRKRFKLHYKTTNTEIPEITEFWIDNVSNKLFLTWKDTPWDFNGTATRPGQGSIACGYFVTSIVRDMDLKIDRNKLSVCASSQMMKALCPKQKIINLTSLSYSDFDNHIKKAGKGVYIIGLDFHTGIIVNDGKENWFIHSNYIQRKGVTRETILQSSALYSSKTRWLVSLTKDKDFINRWLMN